jgi:hypothetical protein
LELLYKLLYYWLKRKDLLIYIFRHFININFKLKSYLLAIKDLKDIHSSNYMNSVLLETLKEYNIEYNITR